MNNLPCHPSGFKGKKPCNKEVDSCFLSACLLFNPKMEEIPSSKTSCLFLYGNTNHNFFIATAVGTISIINKLSFIL
jgi:hypothetical protein